jgi:ketosteroid isomerase-like protein
MSQENVETFRRSLEAFDRRDKASWLETRDEDYEVVTSNEWPEGDVRGREAAWDFYVTIADTFERRPFSDDIEVIDAGPDNVVVHQRNDVPGGESGVNVVLDYWIVLSFRDGKIIRDQWFENRDEAFEVAGLRDQ